MVDFVSPTILLAPIKWIRDKLRLRKIQRHAPSAELVNTVVSMTAEEYYNLPPELRRMEGVGIILREHPPSDGGGGSEPDDKIQD